MAAAMVLLAACGADKKEASAPAPAKPTAPAPKLDDAPAAEEAPVQKPPANKDEEEEGEEPDEASGADKDDSDEATGSKEAGDERLEREQGGKRKMNKTGRDMVKPNNAPGDIGNIGRGGGNVAPAAAPAKKKKDGAGYREEFGVEGKSDKDPGKKDGYREEFGVE